MIAITASTTSGVSSVTTAFRNAGVVDEHVDPAQLALDPPGEPFDAVEVGEVDGPHLRVGRVLADPLEHFGEACFAARADADDRAALGEAFGQRGADTR